MNPDELKRNGWRKASVSKLIRLVGNPDPRQRWSWNGTTLVGPKGRSLQVMLRHGCWVKRVNGTE